ncbi:MAG: GntR family transcriptional regulator [Bacteroidota bacterium]
MPIELNDSTPLYLQIVDDIKAQIASKKLKVGEKIGSHSELAAHYGVSLITIKKALATMIYEGVAFSRVGMGTYVAKSLLESNQREQQTIGLVFRDIRSPFFSRVMDSVEEAAYKLGYHVLISNSSNKAEREDSQIARFRKFGVKGMIIASMTHEYHATPTIKKLLQEHFPFVMVSYIADEDIPFVGCDHELGGFIATNYLIKLGYQRIGYINGEKGNEVGNLRLQGYKRALRIHGRQIDEGLLFHLGMRGEWYDYQSGYEIGKQFKKIKVQPDAMFVYNDLAALGFEYAILEQGLRVPEDVAIIGFDDIESGQFAATPLTTIQQPTNIIGHQAMDVLVRQIEGKKGSIRRILKPQLIIRDSCVSGRKTISSKIQTHSKPKRR